jgi:hypothetical protein
MIRNYKVFLFVVLFCCLSLNYSFAQLTPAQVEIGLDFSDNLGFNFKNIVAFGLDASVTDGYDGRPYEDALPPFSPALEIRFVVGIYESYTDIQNAPSFPFSGSKVHTLKWQVSSGANSLTINYDLPSGVSIVIGYLLGNSPTLTGSGSYTLSNANIVTQATITATYDNYITDVNDEKMTINDFALDQNYPNPFNPATKIKYSIPNNGYVQLNVYDLLGNQVATLVNQQQSAGNYEIDFNAGNLSSGIYLYQLKSNGKTLTHKMTLLK